MKTETFRVFGSVGNRLLSGKSEHVQLELSNSTIRHMMIDSSLAGEELHCLNQSSKKVIKRILLDKLARSMNQGLYSSS